MCFFNCVYFLSLFLLIALLRKHVFLPCLWNTWQIIRLDMLAKEKWGNGMMNCYETEFVDCDKFVAD